MKMKEMLVAWLARRLPTCKEVTRMASDAMERKLPWRQWINMKLHFLICAACLRYFTQLQFMKYHGLLIAATRPPLGRMVLLSKLDETIVIDGQRFDLGCNRYPGAVHPRGFEYLQAFSRSWRGLQK